MKVLYGIQFFFLFVTQLLTLSILNKLNIRPWIKALIIFYIGISPGLVNSALSLFSEIVTYPFILAIVLLSSHIWEKARALSYKKIIISALALCALCIAITFSKAIFSYISFPFILTFLILALFFFYKKDFKTAVKLLVFLVIVSIPFIFSIKAFKMANYHYNGLYAFSDRTWLLFGNTDRRTRTMTPRLFWAGLSFIPGENICNSSFTKEECFYWSIMEADTFAYYKNVDMNKKGVKKEDWEKEYVSGSFKMIKHNPIQYSFFFVAESLKMFFWESTQIGTVIYPKWLENIFACMPIKNGIRLLLSFLTFISFIHLITTLLKNKKTILSSPSTQTSICFMIFTMIVVYIFFYSIVQIIPRYLFTIAPLYLINIGLWINSILDHKKI
jgi:hypothetical protein